MLFFTVVVVVAFVTRKRLLLFGLLMFFLLCLPVARLRWQFYPLPLFENVELGNFRWSIGKYTYLASAGFYLVVAICSVALVERLQRILKGATVRIGALALFVLFIVANLIFIIEREDEWQQFTMKSKEEVKYLVDLKNELSHENHNFSNDQVIVTAGFYLYYIHTQYLSRAIFENNGIYVFNASDNYEEKWEKSRGKRVLFIAKDISGKFTRQWVEM